jgi:4-amino-4-deoxy-L-arabinose transferase-like glycosyltransferase
MQLLEQIRQYYADEKSGAVYALAAGFIFLSVSAWLWLRFSSNQLSRGLATGFIFAGVLLLVMGIGSIFYNNNKIKGTEKMQAVSERSLQQSEILRMDKVMNVTFHYAFIVFAILMVLALIIILFGRNEYWKGIGIVLMLLVAMVIISDSFSMQRNKAYQQKISMFKF